MTEIARIERNLARERASRLGSAALLLIIGAIVVAMSVHFSADMPWLLIVAVVVALIFLAGIVNHIVRIIRPKDATAPVLVVDDAGFHPREGRDVDWADIIQIDASREGYRLHITIESAARTSIMLPSHGNPTSLIDIVELVGRDAVAGSQPGIRAEAEKRGIPWEEVLSIRPQTMP